jgi:CRISPR-associated protein Cmr6
MYADLAREYLINDRLIKKNLEQVLGVKTPMQATHQKVLDTAMPQIMQLKTAYPGLLLGIGYAHGLKSITSDVKMGFSFDHTTGMPVIPGSSVKGVLRSAFGGRGDVFAEEKQEYIIDILKQLLTGEHLESLNRQNKEQNRSFVSTLEREIFEGVADDLKRRCVYQTDLFLDAFPVRATNRLMGEDYTTPHITKDRVDFEGEYYPDEYGEFKNPVPVKMLKVNSDVTFQFQFRLCDSKVGQVVVTGKQKLDLFKQILLDFGIGAKTNSGYGQFIECEQVALIKDSVTFK